MMTDKSKIMCRNGYLKYQQSDLMPLREPLECCDKTGIYTAAPTGRTEHHQSCNSQLFLVLHPRHSQILLKGNTPSITVRQQ